MVFNIPKKSNVYSIAVPNKRIVIILICVWTYNKNINNNFGSFKK